MNKIYIVLKNSDFNEGKGLMLIHKTFSTLNAARNYIKKEPGICGSKQYENPLFFQNDYETWNGYEIKTMDIEK